MDLYPIRFVKKVAKGGIDTLDWPCEKSRVKREDPQPP